MFVGSHPGSASHIVPFCPFVGFSSIAFTSVSSMMIGGGTRPAP